MSSPASPQRILDLLKDAADNGSGAGIRYLERGVNEPATVVSYAQLFQQVKDNASRLLHAGLVENGSTVITYFDTHAENVLWFWSVVAAGGVCAVLNPVSNDPKTTAGQLENIRALFGTTPLLTSHKLSSIFASQKLKVLSVEELGRRRDSARSSPAEPHPANPNDIAAILFTSGSTGHSKAVKYSHAQLIESVRAKSNHLSTKGKTFMSWISFDHSACFCEVHLQAIYNGSDQVFVPTADLVSEPWRFFQALSSQQVGYSFSPNFFLAAAVDSLAKQDTESFNLDLSHLSVLMCGGEANRTKTLAAVDQVLRQYGARPNAIKAAYGLSETCAACYYNLETPGYDLANSNAFATVGKPLPGLECKIVPLSDDQADQDQGVIHLRGEVIFKGYHHNDAATAACMTEDKWMNTGDIGRIDANGNLQILGRAKEVLILNGNNFSSFEIEHAIESSNIAGLAPSYTAVFSTWDQERDSEAPVVLFNPTEDAIGPKNLRATLQEIDKAVFRVCAQKALHIIPLPKRQLPKSTIGKLSRAKLRQSFEKGAFSDFIIEKALPEHVIESEAEPRLEDLSPLQQEIAKIYASVVGVPVQGLLGRDALLSSGINSIGFIRLKKALEKGLKINQEIPMPMLIRCHSIAELERDLTLIGTVSQQYDPIVPLATKGTKQPLFLLHPGSGDFLCWIGLTKYLADRPLYAIRAKGLYPGEDTFTDLDDILQTYSAAIRRIQPVGPYALLGYCFGGMLGFELTKLFEAAGETVVFCGGIDNPPCLKTTVGQVRYRALMIDVLPVVTPLSASDARSFADETAALSDEEFYAHLFTKFSPEFIANMDITVPRLQGFARVEDAMRRIAMAHEPAGTVATADIFCADPMPHFGASPEVWRREVLAQWKSYTRHARVRFHEVQGTHISLIREPCIRDFQRVVNDALQARGI